MSEVAAAGRKETETSEEPFVKTKVEGNIYHVILNRPAKRNSIPPAMVQHIEEAFIQADRYPEVRAIIVSAEGPVFSAGIDLTALGRDRSPNGEDPGRGSTANFRHPSAGLRLHRRHRTSGHWGLPGPCDRPGA